MSKLKKKKKITIYVPSFKNLEGRLEKCSIIEK